MTILITGAAGKTGRAILHALAGRGVQSTALVHRQQQADDLRQAGADRVVLGDMADPDALAEAMRSARTVYHICPNVSPDEVALGQQVIESARAGGIEHFVYHSVLHPQTEAMPHHWGKLRVEELIFQSGLPFTILQPAAYMQNLLPRWQEISEQGLYRAPYPPETRLSMVDLEDVAEAAANVLTQADHIGATYELVGPGYLSQTDIAHILSEVLDHPVRAEQIPLDTWRQNAERSGMSAQAMDTLIKMFAYYESYGLRGNPNVLGWLIGRPPTSFEDFARRLNSAASF
jgi:uncharacterized protein YbjT (DUF2867 family)